MTFTIDTGVTASNSFAIDRVAMVLDGIADALPDNPTQAQIDDAVVQIVTGELRKPKTMPTVRRMMTRYWPVIAPLAEREPAQFDALMLEYVDRLALLSE